MQKAEVHVECHFYSAGLKSKFIGENPRPAYLPSHESVGLTNEAHLMEEDYCVEFLRRRSNDRKVAWLAVHVPAVDDVYGDRGNYCGVGVWFVESSPCAVFKLLDALMQLARVLSKQGVSGLFEKGVVTFSREYLPGHFIPTDEIPSEFGGLVYSGHDYDKSNYRAAQSQGAITERLGAIAVSVLAACYKRESTDANRIVFFDCPSGKITASPVDPLALGQDAVTVDAILRRQLVDASQDIARANQAERMVEEIVKRKNQLVAMLDSNQAKIDSLVGENASLKEKNTSLSATIDSLRKDIEDSSPRAFVGELAESRVAKGGVKKKQDGRPGAVPPHDVGSRILEELWAIKRSLKRIEDAATPSPSDAVPGVSAPGWRSWLSGNYFFYIALSAAVILLCLIVVTTVRQA